MPSNQLTYGLDERPPLQVLLLTRLANRARVEQQGPEAVLRLHFEH